jgi:hypothetical protein
LARGPLASIARERNWGGNKAAEVARDAGAYAYLKDAAEARNDAGARVGEVIKTLFALVGSKDPRASIESAIEVVERKASRHKGASRTQLYDEVKLLQPALHLWGAWSTYRGRNWMRDRKDTDTFLGEAEIIRQQLVAWNGGRQKPMTLSGLLSPYVGWPIPTELSIQAISLLPEDAPQRKPPGRPKTHPKPAG